MTFHLKPPRPPKLPKLKVLTLEENLVANRWQDKGAGRLERWRPNGMLWAQVLIENHQTRLTVMAPSGGVIEYDATFTSLTPARVITASIVAAGL